ncbi:MAG: hypothetical protein Fur0041_21720 [Bacteroidia bacterium]
MKFLDSIPNPDKINYLNIGLILLSIGVAFYIPFELFLFSYAVLGPAHYLTEISWLHQREYFTGVKRDYILLSLAALVLFLLIYVVKKTGAIDPATNAGLSTAVVFIAFASALVMVLVKNTFTRFIAFIIIAAISFLSKNAALFFSVFLPTLIHVYLFTGLFMLYGALKGRSKSGYISVAVFFLAPLLFILIDPTVRPLSAYAFNAYQNFQVLNFEVLKLWDTDIFSQWNPPVSAVYYSAPGIVIMRFIAFAYTYHYLNWFSKTSVIKWHEVPKKRLAVIAGLWILAVSFYFYDYKIGFHVLFLLSFLHVFLEFPLNHITFIGIFTELKAMMGGKSEAAPVKGKKK